MAIMPLVLSPDPLLKKVSKIVEKVDSKIQKLMDDMLDTMYQEKGIGLAAVQVGVLKRILVMDVEYEFDDHHDHDHGHHCGLVHVKNAQPLFMINPEIKQSSKEASTFNEGCLSFPDARAEVNRPKFVTVSYLDYNGEEKILEAKGILATCVQHEIDHLNGVTFVDHISRLKRDMILKKMLKKHKS